MNTPIKSTRGRAYADNRDIKVRLGLKATDKLPVRTAPVKMEGWIVYVRPPIGKQRKHRARAICLACGWDVSAGRTHQHRCKPDLICTGIVGRSKTPSGYDTLYHVRHNGEHCLCGQ